TLKIAVERSICAHGRTTAEVRMGPAQRFVEALDSHDGSRVAALMASEFRWEDLGAGLVFENADALVAFIAGCDAFSTDYRFTLVSEQVSEVDYALEWEMAGTNTGTFRG